MADFGLMYYGARWYDSALSRFAQADTIILQPGNALAWDRYAYALNNALHYVDPTGHMSSSAIHDSDGDAQCNNPVHCLDTRGKHKVNVPSVPKGQKQKTNGSEFKPDGDLYTATDQIGIGGWYAAGGWDIVITDKEIGVFNTTSYGPALDCEIGMCQENSDRNFFTPQFGVSFQLGEVYGEDIRVDVSDYQGTALLGGGSIMYITAEHFTSVDLTTGHVDNRVYGDSSGVTFGLPPVEGHVMNVRAEYNQFWSKLLTQIGQFLNILP